MYLVKILTKKKGFTKTVSQSIPADGDVLTPVVN